MRLFRATAAATLLALAHAKSTPVRAEQRGFGEILKQWSAAENTKLDAEKHAWVARGGSAETTDSTASPLHKVTLPPAYKDKYGASCLDGTPFAYYVRKAPDLTDKWIIFLQGGGLCIEPFDCRNRQTSYQGSSSENYGWGYNYTIVTDGAQDMLSDDPELNPSFYNYNHVFMPYCTGDTWSGQRYTPLSDNNQFYFAGHGNVNATVAHLKVTQGLSTATDVLLSGSSAGGIGSFHNADYFYEHYFSSAVNVKTAPISGAYFPGPVVFYPEYLLGVDTPVNSLASKYLSWWFQTALDESCMAALGPEDAYQCWDYSVSYDHISAPLFIAENRFDSNQIEDVLLCLTCGSENTSYTNGFIEQFGDTMSTGLLSTVLGDVGLAKGDGLFSPSCYDHTSAFCMQGGQVVLEMDEAGGAVEVRLQDVLPVWFAEGASSDGGKYQHVDTCVSDMPCNAHCYC